jgi:hypothetical protein
VSNLLNVFLCFFSRLRRFCSGSSGTVGGGDPTRSRAFAFTALVAENVPFLFLGLAAMMTLSMQYCQIEQ